MFREKSLSDDWFLHFSRKVQNLTVFAIIFMIRVRFFGLEELNQNGFRAARYSEGGFFEETRGNKATVECFPGAPEVAPPCNWLFGSWPYQSLCTTEMYFYSGASAAAAAVAKQQTGMATTADLVTLQQQIRQEMADSLQRVREEMHTQSMAGWMQSAASPVPFRGFRQVQQKQPSRTGSAT